MKQKQKKMKQIMNLKMISNNINIKYFIFNIV